MVRLLSVAVSTAGGVGFLPIAPGTFGSALAIPIFVLFSPSPILLLALTWLGLLALGTWAADGSEAVFGRKDDGRIVIDEVVGQLLTLAPLLGGHLVGDFFCEPASGIGWLVTGFVAFRVFDIWKPGPVRWAERSFRGGLGVMMDDVVAGILGALTLIVALTASAVFGGAG